MTKLIATLGTSPGGIFESYINLVKGNYETSENKEKVEINDVYIIRTSDREVEFAWKLVKALFTCFKEELPTRVTISDIVVEIQDITSKEDYEKFKKALEGKINVNDYVDFTGGRKAMSVAASIEAMRRKAHIITTIIPQQEYNRIQQLIKNLKEKEKLIEEAANGKCENVKDDLRKLLVSGAKTILLS